MFENILCSAFVGQRFSLDHLILTQNLQTILMFDVIKVSGQTSPIVI